MPRDTRTAKLLSGLLIWTMSFPVGSLSAGQAKETAAKYKVLAPLVQNNLEIFPVVVDSSPDTGRLLTLEEGIRAGQVIVTEQSEINGLVRPRNHTRPTDGGIWTEIPFPRPQRGAQVNELAIVNKSDRPLLLLAGEIVTGGKQDRVVGRDRIIPPHSEPVALSVFCVEPHRWTGASVQFGALPSSMAQPSIRFEAMADKNQQSVWDEVARSRADFLKFAPAPAARELASTSSYAMSVDNDAVKGKLDSLAGPIDRRYEILFGQLRAEKAVGAVVAVDGEIIWADVFASSSLLEKYWPKLIRSYAAEALTTRVRGAAAYPPATRDQAQAFLDRFDAKNENIETEPGIYRSTEYVGADFDAFVLAGLLPDTRYTIHIAKMSK